MSKVLDDAVVRQSEAGDPSGQGCNRAPRETQYEYLRGLQAAAEQVDEPHGCHLRLACARSGNHEQPVVWARLDHAALLGIRLERNALDGIYGCGHVVLASATARSREDPIAGSPFMRPWTTSAT